jgi:dTDP-3-amino-3,4,6-trideoxy-alpha-D-glucose transaminase
MRHLARNNIGTAVHYAPPLHHHPAFAPNAQFSLPLTERFAETLLSLPIQPEIAAAQVGRISESIARFESVCAP